MDTYRRPTTRGDRALSHHEEERSWPSTQRRNRRQPGHLPARYEQWIGGEYVAPASGLYSENPSPVNGKVFCEVARGNDVDIELDAAHAAAPAWGRMSTGERGNILNKIADRIEANPELIAVAETWDNGKPIRETVNADIPLVVDHFRHVGRVVRGAEDTISQIDDDTVAHDFSEPLGVVGQIIPWNFPILMATWKLAPALAAGNCVVIKPAEQTPVSLVFVMELVADPLPPGVINIVNGFGVEAGKPLASSPRIAKIAFTGETTTGHLIMQYASQNLIPVTLELGGKSPNIFVADVAREKDDFYSKAIEGVTMFAFNQGEVCTCPSRALIQSSIHHGFLADATESTLLITQGNPLDTDTMLGAQASIDQLEKILSYIDIGRQEGARLVTGGERAHLDGDLDFGGPEPVEVWMGRNQFGYWSHTHLTIDVVPGRGAGFSLEAPTGNRFLLRSRLFTEEESAWLVAPPTGQAPCAWVTSWYRSAADP